MDNLPPLSSIDFSLYERRFRRRRMVIVVVAILLIVAVSTGVFIATRGPEPANWVTIQAYQVPNSDTVVVGFMFNNSANPMMTNGTAQITVIQDNTTLLKRSYKLLMNDFSLYEPKGKAAFEGWGQGYKASVDFSQPPHTGTITARVDWTPAEESGFGGHTFSDSTNLQYTSRSP